MGCRVPTLAALSEALFFTLRCVCLFFSQEKKGCKNGAEVRKQSGCYELKDKFQVLICVCFKEMMKMLIQWLFYVLFFSGKKPLELLS